MLKLAMAENTDTRIYDATRRIRGPDAYLAGAILDDDEAILSDGSGLLGEGQGSTGVGVLEVDVVMLLVSHACCSHAALEPSGWQEKGPTSPARRPYTQQRNSNARLSSCHFPMQII